MLRRPIQRCILVRLALHQIANLQLIQRVIHWPAVRRVLHRGILRQHQVVELQLRHNFRSVLAASQAIFLILAAIRLQILLLWSHRPVVDLLEVAWTNK